MRQQRSREIRVPLLCRARRKDARQQNRVDNDAICWAGTSPAPWQVVTRYRCDPRRAQTRRPSTVGYGHRMPRPTARSSAHLPGASSEKVRSVFRLRLQARPLQTDLDYSLIFPGSWIMWLRLTRSETTVSRSLCRLSVSSQSMSETSERMSWCQRNQHAR